MSTTRRFALIAILIASLLAFSACVKAPEKEIGLPEGAPVGEIVELMPENISYWDFQDGPPAGWDYSPGWEFKNGNAVSEAGEQVMITGDQWTSFNLITRLAFGPESIFELQFRAGPEGAYQIFFEPGAVILTSLTDGGVKELHIEQTEFEAGWHDLNMVVDFDYVGLYIDGRTLFEIDGLRRDNAGPLIFMHHGGGRLAIDFIEVHAFDREGAPQAGGEEESVGEVFNAPAIVIPEPPVAARISFSAPDESYRVQVTGEAGAVQPGSLVSIANLQTTRVYFVMADQDGGFSKEIFAYPGSALQIKHFYTEAIEEPELDRLISSATGGEIILEWHNAAVGAVVQVPIASEQRGDGIAFNESGFLRPLANAYWYVDGLLDVVNPSPEDLQVQVTGTLMITSLGAMEEIDFAALSPSMHVDLVRHFDGEGNHSVIRKYLVSDFLTPTGFPIYHGEFPWSTIAGHAIDLEWRQVGPDTMAADVRIDIINERRIPIPEGIYGLRIEVAGWDPIEIPPSEGPTMRSGVVFGPGGFYTPVFRVGNPGPPQLHWGLLTDTLHEATRGTNARQDQNRISLLPLISLQDKSFVLPRDDPRTGERRSYRLEPYLPLISYGDRGIPSPPTIEFAFPSGDLQVLVSRPDGGTDELGPAPFVQAVNTTPSYDFGKVLDYSIGGGAMQEVYQLTTLGEAFAYQFDQYGHYVIEMTGTIDDVDGNSYTGGGTYDVYVARPLKISAGMLPSAPFIEGDVFSPSLQVFPRMPVEVDLRLTFLPDSSTERAIEVIYSGSANDYGYYFPGDHEPFIFSDGGEYRVDLTAQYQDADGTLWMASATYGNVVENKNTPLIAHGSRGLDNPEINNLWFFHQQLDVDTIQHTLFPYYSGDIFWGHDAQGDDSTVKGADAIIPGISLEDTSGVISQLLKRSWDSGAHAIFDVPEGGFQEAIDAGEVRPFSATSTGRDLSWFPEQINQYGYVYQSSQRPDARVHESLSEGVIPIGYWRYVGTYGDQVGVEGDLPNDLKWQFGGVVFRDLQRGINEYAAYGSLWVLLPNDDPTGARVTPPFQGATGGPNGGPILTLKGEEIDLFFLPRSGFPGQILEIGDVLSFSGYVGPPLDSKLTITVTSPSGQVRVVEGQANHVGYFYQAQEDFIVDEPGVWTVDLEVLHDGLTSSGPTSEPYPSGSVLGASEGSYEIYVVERGGTAVVTSSPAPGFIQFSRTPLPPIEFSGVVPPDFQNAAYSYTIAMPGYILEQGQGKVEGINFGLIYDPVSLNRDFLNLDLTAFDDLRPGLADQVWISILFGSEGRSLAHMITLRGEEVFHR